MVKVRGFTMLELIAVLSVAAIVSAFIFFRTPALSPYSLDAQAETLARDIRLTQTLAVTYNTWYRIQFSANSYQILVGTAGTTGFIYPGTASSTISLPSGMSLSSTQSTIRFNNMGQPYDGSGNVLASQVTVTLTADGLSALVTVQPQTGLAGAS